MPAALARACSACGAPTVGRCPCRPAPKDRHKPRGTTGERGYDQRWRHAAARFLRTYPLCGMRPNGLPAVMSRCADEGRVTPATQCDHVIPHRGDRKLLWNLNGNCQSLCATCHGRKSRSEGA